MKMALEHYFFMDVFFFFLDSSPFGLNVLFCCSYNSKWETSLFLVHVDSWGVFIIFPPEVFLINFTEILIFLRV